METRNILDTLGNVIGSLELPEGTSETIWAEKLAQYSTNVVNTPKIIVETITKNSNSSTTTSSSTASVIGEMSIVPAAGTFKADFSGTIFTGGASASGEFGIYVDGVLLPETRREINCSLQLLGGLVSVSLNTIGVGTFTGTEIVLNGNETIDVRFKSLNGGTIGFKERVFTLLRTK